MKLEFTKMHGTGNDYIYLDCFKDPITNLEELAPILSDRHKGIGGDGVILVMPSQVADVRMRMFNADGSEGMMCGNGSRCVAKFAYDRGYVHKKEFTLETKSGIKNIKVKTGQEGKVVSVTVDMGTPVLKTADIPMACEDDTFIDKDINGYKATCLSMGNPHCVVFIEKDVTLLNLENIGPTFEKHKFFPDRVNTEFVNVITPKHLFMRVWERGSGETLACGTGACATVVAAVLNGYCKRDVDIKVELLGGNLKVNWAIDNHVYMTGNAVEVFSGIIEI